MISVRKVYLWLRSVPAKHGTVRLYNPFDVLLLLRKRKFSPDWFRIGYLTIMDAESHRRATTQKSAWGCEMLSPTTRHIDQNEKRAIYARESISHLWFVDPDTKTLEVFKIHKGQWLLLDTLTSDAPVSQPPFEAISFLLDALWPDGEEESG